MLSPDQFAEHFDRAGLRDVAAHTSALSGLTATVRGTFRKVFSDPLGRVSSNAPTFRVTATVAAGIKDDDLFEVTASASGVTGAFKVASRQNHDGGGDVLLILKKA